MSIYPDGMSISSKLLITEIERRGWRFDILPKPNFILVHMSEQESFLLHNALTELNSAVGYEIAADKELFYAFAERKGFAVPRTLTYSDIQSASDFLVACRQLVVKPATTDKGLGITTGITDIETLQKAVAVAERYSDRVLLQMQHSGSDYRLLVIGDTVHAVAKRTPATVVGDGVHTIGELIDITNDYHKGMPKNYIGLKIKTGEVEDFMGASALTLIPSRGEIVQIMGVANISRGGDFSDCTAETHPEIKALAVQIAQSLRMGVVGVDVLTEDISKPLSESNAVVLEINKMPGLLMHEYGNNSSTSRVASAIIDEILLSRAIG